LNIYDILGRKVIELINRPQETGYRRINWDGRNNQGKEVASGIYFCVLKSRGATDIRKMLLIK
jgi:flagellar hook assembly protein FlgD